VYYHEKLGKDEGGIKDIIIKTFLTEADKRLRIFSSRFLQKLMKQKLKKE